MLYFAYGANLHPLRLAGIVPSCRVVAPGVLADHELRFHKRSLDGSAKCDAFPWPDAAVHGVLYRLDTAEQAALDRAEPGYDRVAVSVTTDAGSREAFTYRARADHVAPALRPYTWYREVVLLGARLQRLPPDYVARIERVPADDDPDAERAGAAARLIESLRVAEGLT